MSSKLKDANTKFSAYHETDNKVIKELEELAGRSILPFDEAETLKEKVEYEPIRHFLNSLLNKVKPETATGELFQSLIQDIVGQRAFSEVAQKTGFVDFSIQETKVNPILIELKPFFKVQQKQKQLKPDELVYLKHKDQILKYLNENDFIILTNLKDAYLFNRDALLKFQPFAEIPFPELLKRYIASHNSFWDTVRRLEESTYKPELDEEFFKDLKKWYEELEDIELKETPYWQKKELIVLFINKIIFIKTLEDYGLIPFKFLTDQYKESREKWEVKGVKNVLRYFFDEIENWFWEYYDTELFQTSFWDHLDKSKANLQSFQEKFEKILGLGNRWSAAYGKGMIHYNYREIDEDVFGKAYETFIAEARKDAGIYYTPRSITTYMVKNLIKGLFKAPVDRIRKHLDNGDIESAKTELTELEGIKIIDTAAGSGSFLIKAIKEIYRYYELIMKDTQWVEKQQGGDLFDHPKIVRDTQDFRKFGFFDDPRRLVSSLIIKHIHGIDLDERALETAKTNIWKEAVKLNPPVFNYRKLNEDLSHILPNLGMNFRVGDALVDLPISFQLSFLSENHSEDLVKLHEIRNSYLSNPSDPDLLEELEPIKDAIRGKLAEKLSFKNKPVFIPLEFFYAYFDDTGAPLPQAKQGFDGLVSNPPWEEIYPVKKEFMEVGKYGIDKSAFEKQFEQKLNEDADFKEAWGQYRKFYREYTEFISERYEYHDKKPVTSTAMRSHLNYFKLFFERNVEALKQRGLLSILIPSSFQTDEGTFGLRELSILKNKLLEITSFENRGYEKEAQHRKFFPDVHPQFKFSFIFLEKSELEESYSFNSRFYLLDPNSLKGNNFIEYNQEKVRKFSPYALSLMEFRSQKDYELCDKIKAEHKVLLEQGFLIRREFNVSDDRELFMGKQGKNGLPVYEGKNIHQYDVNFSPVTKFMNEGPGRDNLLNKEAGRIKKNLKLEKKTKKIAEDLVTQDCNLDYQTYRLAFRAIGRSTDERTFIVSFLPPNAFSVNSINCIVNHYYDATQDEEIHQTKVPHEKLLYLLSIFNSLTINYYLRNKVSANLNMFYIYELPVPEPTNDHQIQINQMALNLLASKDPGNAFDDLAKAINQQPEQTIDPIMERAELEVFIAKNIFGLNKKDWEYLTSTFVYGGESFTKQELDAIIEKSLAFFDQG